MQLLKYKRPFFTKFAIGALLSFLAAGCGDESLGSAESFAPLLEQRYKVLAAARLLRTQYQPNAPEYQVGELLYAEAYSSTNSVLQQILTSLRAETVLPEPEGSVDCLEGFAGSSEEPSGQVPLLCNIQDAIEDSEEFYSYVSVQICNRPENASLCDAWDLSGRNAITDFLPIPDLANSLFDAINESIKFARENREDRRKELATQYTNLLLPAFSEVGQVDPANSNPSSTTE